MLLLYCYVWIQLHAVYMHLCYFALYWLFHVPLLYYVLVFSSSSVLVQFHHLIFFLIRCCSSNVSCSYINVVFLIHSSTSLLCFLFSSHLILGLFFCFSFHFLTLLPLVFYYFFTSILFLVHFSIFFSSALLILIYPVFFHFLHQISFV